METYGRHRNRRIVVPGQNVYLGVLSGGAEPDWSKVPKNAYIGESLTRLERIWDSKERFNRAHLYPDHPVDHFKVVGSTVTIPDWVTRRFQSGQGYIEETHVVRPQMPFSMLDDLVLDKIPAVPEQLLDELAYNALRRFSDDIQKQGSLLNFLYELKDFRNLIGPLRGLLGRLAEFVSKPGLTWEFAIKPFFEDLKKLIGAFDYVHKRIKFLREHNGQQTVVSYTVSSVADQMSFYAQHPLLVEFPENWDMFQYRAYATAFKCTFRAHSVIRINAEFLDRLDKQFDAYASAIGIGSIFDWIEAGYKAFPFSWLADFFFRTNRLFDQLDSSIYASLGENPIEVLTTTWSLKKETTVEFWTRLPSAPDLFKVGEYVATEYQRANGLPFSGNSWLRFHGWTQDLSMIAILLQILFPGFHGLTSQRGRRRKVRV